MVDNGNLVAKLELRRHFLAKYHSEIPPRVFDACQGSGRLWARLRREFQIASYWGVDVKHKKGRIKFDSRRIIEGGIEADVIDIDTYGSPWKHYLALLKSGIKHEITVFLTLGMQNSTAFNPFSQGADILQVPAKTPRILLAKIARRIAVSYWVTRCYEYDTIPVEIMEATGGRAARYFGIRLRPEKSQCLEKR